MFNTIVSRETLRFLVFLVLFVVFCLLSLFVLAFVSSFVCNELVGSVLLICCLFNAIFVLLFHVKHQTQCKRTNKRYIKVYRQQSLYV